ncbi:MAG TPA: lantibiotic dehydratase [Bryobacteraceae bacterium]|jgi:thiopeptide-type bacteriocin biosynthesis protein|nr:lantibiotic dehydratase [Bryobacteraceae bacterium]
MGGLDREPLAGEFTHSGFFVLRTPLLPFAELTAWSEGTSCRRVWEEGRTAECLATAWEQDARLLRERLRSMIERPEIEHALYVASTSLQVGIESWKRTPGDKKGVQAERALVRYFARMSGRSTPFGLFSGCSTGRLATEPGAVAELALMGLEDYKLRCRLDFDYLFALATALQRDWAIAEGLRYWPNASIHKTGGAWHYAESRLTGSARSHHLVKVEADEYVNTVLHAAAPGATIAELAQAILPLAGPDATQEDAVAYVRELIVNGVLESSLAPPVTGKPALDDLLSQMEALPGLSDAAGALEWARDRMAAIDRAGVRALPRDYAAIAAKLESLPVKSELSKLFQVDMVKPARNAVLTEEVVDEVIRGVELLCRLGETAEIETLNTFKETFTARYDRAWIPLMEALDEDMGIGFGHAGRESSPLLRGFRWGGKQPKGGAARGLRSILTRRIWAQQEVNRELELDPAELPAASIDAHALPDAFAVLAVLVAPSAASIRKGDFRILLNALMAPGGARSFGRFCHADAGLEACVRSHLREEESLRPEALFAEIVYLPEERMGNVVCRPVLRQYELVYMGRSGAPVERQIPVSDLMIGVRDGRIVLRSWRLGKEVIPRLTNAHGFANVKLPSVYRFLCHLQYQDFSLPRLSWGELENLDYLPRVRVGKLILATARWRLHKEEIARISEPDKALRFAAVQELRRGRGLPRWVVLEQSDRTLPVDLDNVLAVDAFVHVIQREQEVTLRELFPAPEALCVEGPEGRFCHELHLPLVRRRRKHLETREPTAIAAGFPNVNRSARSLPPGSEWLFLKLYGGAAAVDDALTGTIRPLLDKLASEQIAGPWFFVRYRDPENHLRIRFRGEPARLTTELMPLISTAVHPLVETGAIYKIQFDTYEREIERYGGLEGVIAAEELFWADSEAVLEILPELSGDEGLDHRWRAALLGIHILLTDFGFDLPARRFLLETLRNSYYGEFGVEALEKKSLGDRFRAERGILELMLDGNEPGEIASVRRAFERRSVRNCAVAAKLRALADAGRLQTTIDELMPSYAHMHVNRMMRSDWRDQELVLYDFLFRLYDGQLARNRDHGIR